MKLIAANEALAETLSRLIKTYPHAALAVAWASSGNPVFTLLKRHSDRVTRAVIGTHFYQTHPDVLDAFLGTQNIRFVLQPTGVFHPKVYAFWNDRKWEALIGSANLTTGAMSTNSEAMVLLAGSEGATPSIKDDIVSLINDYWSTAKTIMKSDAAAYREVWTRKQAALRRVTGQYGATKPRKPPTDSSVMSMSWQQYFAKVRADPYHGYENRCELLARVGRAFAQHNSFASMPTPLRKTIAGLPNELESRWGWFGSMRGAGFYHQAVNENNPHLSRSLDCIPLNGIVTRQEYDDYIEEFVKAFPNGRHGVGVASRLLAMKRPDQFVCLDAKNQASLCSDFGIVRVGMDYDRYWDEIVERILDAPWWNVKRPTAPQQARVWQGRAAMLDAIFYRE